MKEWRYLVFLVKYHLNRWIREKKQGGVFYIGGSDVFPPPLKPEEELVLLEQLGGEEDVTVKAVLIERNLRLVVYIARKFENTGINVEDLISIGTIGLIKAINTFKVDKKIKLATYASRCIENEILMYLRRNSKTKTEVSIDEPLNVDWEGNELLLSDILGTENDIITKDIENKVDRELLQDAMQKLSGRERRIVEMRFGILPETEEKTQKEIVRLSKELAAQQGNTTVTYGGYIWPVTTSKRVTSPFGKRNTGIKGASTNHRGIDIGGVYYSSTVYAAKAGTVIISSSNSVRGQYIVISHGSGNTTTYQHLSKRSVSVGAVVKQGQAIGVTGSSGVGSGPHLHFEITENGQLVNPLKYLTDYVKAWN